MDFTNQTVSAGYVVALGLVCLLNYAVYLYRSLLVRQRSRRLERKVTNLETELQVAHNAQALARLETEILREFLAETELNPALDFLLRRFVPNATENFGVFVQLKHNRILSRRGRGLSRESQKNIAIDEEFLEPLQRDKALALEGPALHRSRLLASIAKSDRRKIQKLFLLAVGEEENLHGALIATRLYPAGSCLEWQIELGKRLMCCVAAAFQRAESIETHRHELRFTNEMLGLRKIMDRNFDSPVKMMEEFLDKLRENTTAQRGAVFLATQGKDMAHAALVRCGTWLQPGVRTAWESHEKLLAEAGITKKKPRSFNQEDMKQIGITTVLGSAIVAPLLYKGGTIGSLCLTRKDLHAFSPVDVRLVAWAAECLSDTMFRVLNHAVVERQARQDGLTGLANRRTFDQKVREEAQISLREGRNCSLLLIDLDHFKSTNDTFGHQAGDEVLRVTSQILLEQVAQIRSTDTALVARYGGEEFAVLLPGVCESGAKRIAESIRAAIEARDFTFSGQTMHVTGSCGVATFPIHGQTADDLISVADAALYQAKEIGRNHVCMGAAVAVIEAAVRN